MRPALPFALLAVAIAGCAQPVGFAQFGDFQLHFESTASGFADTRFVYDSGSLGCRVLGDDATATLNGDPLRVRVFPGGNPGTFGSADCLFPQITFTRPGLLSEPIVLSITSGGEELVVEGEGMGSTLSGAPILAPGQAIHAGDRIQVALGGGFERGRWSQVFGALLEAADSTMTPISFSPPSAAGVLDVQLPPGLPAGRAHLRADVPVDPSFSNCGAPLGCAFDASFPLRVGLDLPIDVSP
jgi:hypothetical protein